MHEASLPELQANKSYVHEMSQGICSIKRLGDSEGKDIPESSMGRTLGGIALACHG